MRCRGVWRILREARGELDPRTRGHLRECGDCARLFEGLLEADRVLREFSVALRGSSQAWVEEGARKALRRTVFTGSFRRGPRIAFAGALAALLVLGLFFGSRRPGGEEQGGGLEEPLRIPVVVEYRDPEGRRHIVAEGTWILPRRGTPLSVEFPPELQERILEALDPASPRPVPVALTAREAEPLSL